MASVGKHVRFLFFAHHDGHWHLYALAPKHVKMLRHMAAMSLGVSLMVAGSGIAANAHSFPVIHHILVDTVGYFLHGIGCVPFVAHVEPLWKLIAE
jgi:hypothetical protein